MTIYIIDLESIESRYTSQWKAYLPAQIKKYTGEKVVEISGGTDIPATTSPGAFLNFGGTSIYKARQLETISNMIVSGTVKDGDYFLYTDAWNPTVIQLKYQLELLGINAKIGGMWHAGSYDPNDFLGRIIGDKPWVRSAEHSMFSCYDHNFFATHYHVELFANGVLSWQDGEGWYETRPEAINSTIRQVGWPMEYLSKELKSFGKSKKRDLILFPHRIAPEKQVEIFKDLKSWLPNYEFVVCQDENLTKEQYHSLLASAKMVFSANLQETLGISWYEGALLDVLPLVPDRLSYSEMNLNDSFTYPSEWTECSRAYDQNRSKLMARITYMMTNYETLVSDLKPQTEFMTERFFHGDELYRTVSNRSK